MQVGGARTLVSSQRMWFVFLSSEDKLISPKGSGDPRLRLEHPLVSVLTAAHREWVVTTGTWVRCWGLYRQRTFGARLLDVDHDEVASISFVTLSREHDLIFAFAAWTFCFGLTWHFTEMASREKRKLENRCSWICVWPLANAECPVSYSYSIISACSHLSCWEEGLGLES